MILTVHHQTIHRYASGAGQISLLLRLRPTECQQQRLINWSVEVNGHEIPAGGPNAFGDDEAHYYVRQVGNELTISATGIVETSDDNGLVNGFVREVRPSIFCRATELTAVDAAIQALAIATHGADPLSRMHDLATRVRDAVAYRAGITTNTTTAAEALQLGQGVCQDHAHIFVAAARSLGIPARYVVGYYLADKSQEALHETHGWAEAFIEHLGWVGFDVTNGVCTTDHYVRLCSGLDARDAAPIKGALFGTREIGIDADVLIGEADASQLQQIQQQQ